MSELFTGPVLKVQRARRHITELAADTASYLARKPFVVVVENQPPEYPDYLGMCVWRVRMREPMPAPLSAIVGDTIHNLRSALDHLAGDIVAHNGGNTSNLYFPFAPTGAALEQSIKDKKMRRASPEALSLLRSLKPYRGGNVDLRAIHDLDIQDKHKRSIAMIGGVTTPPFGLNWQPYKSDTSMEFHRLRWLHACDDAHAQQCPRGNRNPLSS